MMMKRRPETSWPYVLWALESSNFFAYCVPEGTAKEPVMCNQMMPLKCAKPGLSGPLKCDACGCDCTFVNGVAKKLPPGQDSAIRSKKNKL